MPTGAKIKEIRKQKGLTQKQLGDLCGMADSAIRRYENGNANPKIETLQKIATALECDLSDLMDSDEYKLHNIELAIKKANDSVLEKNKEMKDEPLTIATRFDGGKHFRDYLIPGKNTLISEISKQFYDDHYTREELQKILEYAEFIKSQRKE